MKRLWLLFFLPLFVFADSGKISCDKSEVNVGEQIVCRLSVDSLSEYNVINYTIKDVDGISLVDVRSNYSDLWKVDSSSAYASSIVNGLQEFGILLFKADSDGVYSVGVSDISFGMYDSDSMISVDDLSYDIKVISKDNYLSDIKINGESLENFNKNTLFYEIDTFDSEIDVEGIVSNEFAKISGNGKIKIGENDEKVVVVLEVVSESGIYKSYVVTVNNMNYKDNNVDRNLKDVIFKNNLGDTLLINFKSDVYKYDIEVSKKVSSVEISSVLSNKDCSYVKGFGDGEFKIKSGNNIILIKVKDKSGNIKVYTFNVIKPIESLSGNSYLKSLDIDGYYLSFSKKVRNYNLDISSGSKSLVINAVTEDDDAIVSIVGNDNLKDGSVVKVVVTAPDGTTSTYNINIGVKDFNFMIIFYLLIPFVLIYLIIRNRDSIIKFVNSYRSLENMSYEKLLDKYFVINKDKGITKFFDKLSDDVKRDILIEALSNKVLVNKTSRYLDIYRSSRKKSSKKKAKKKKK